MTDLNTLLADLTSGNEPQAEAAAVRFVSLGSEGFYALATLYASPDPEVRWWALRALTEFDDERICNLLLLGLDDEDPGVQACAALGLRKHPTEPAISKLISLLGSEDQLLSRLVRDALVALGKTGTPPLIEIVENKESSHSKRLEAVRALAEIEDPAAIGALFHAYNEGSSLMQHWAEDGLTRLGFGMVFFNPKGQ
ncbi:MAG: HEAT repeat domain-containing protein [Anaerolineales bacterium]|jgi:HEAT repeat protein